MTPNNPDTICAIATASGRGGIGIVRISGSLSRQLCLGILGFEPEPRLATTADFLSNDKQIIDNGIAIFYQGPNSFTGEDILELQGHGGSQILNAVLERVLEFDVRQAHPGEFSERAFLNNKIDLVQAEAIADLIDASSKQAARSAMRTLRGEFSKRISSLQEQLTAARVNVEAAIDFSDEDIEFINDSGVVKAVDEIIVALDRVFAQARQGVIMGQGLHVVIAGKPNAGKSSLMNALSGEESAIVTDIPGTTRDVLRVDINLNGMPVHIVDTAGLRASKDLVEQEGIKRAIQAIEKADLILLVADGTEQVEDVNSLLAPLIELTSEQSLTTSSKQNITIVFNKIDLLEEIAEENYSLPDTEKNYPLLRLSAKTGQGIDQLQAHLCEVAGYQPSAEGDFVARQRHLKSLDSARKCLNKAASNLSEHSPLELVAEDLRLAQRALGAITGEFSSDDLLGEIFSSFCIGK